MNLLVALENEGRIDSDHVIERAVEKYQKRLVAIETGTSWAEVKKRQKRRLMVEDKQKFLEETEIVDYANEDVKALAERLSLGCQTDVEVAKNCFEYVRDAINHSGDHQDALTTYKASDVLKHKIGWCYAKSHLLAALFRANGIPTGFCYQRLSCSEYKDDIYCLHGLNAIFLEAFGWYKVDARGNKEGVNAQFDPPHETLAFELGENEFDLPEIYSEPLEVVIQALKTHTTYNDMINNFPDLV
jgi:transglutaminase-like putative cysteine protease